MQERVKQADVDRTTSNKTAEDRLVLRCWVLVNMRRDGRAACVFRDRLSG